VELCHRRPHEHDWTGSNSAVPRETEQFNFHWHSQEACFQFRSVDFASLFLHAAQTPGVRIRQGVSRS